MNDEEYFVTTYKDAGYAIVDEIKKYENLFAPTFPVDEQMKKEIVRFVVEGGKRFRPALSYLVSKYYGYDDLFPHLALEVFHKYLLTHDDIMDRDDMRYGAATVHKTLEKTIDKYTDNTNEKVHFGNGLAIVAGDLMEAASHRFVLNSSLSAEIKVSLCGLLSTAAEEASFGWYDQLVMDYIPLYSEELSFDRIVRSIIWVTGKYTTKFPLYFGFTAAGAQVPEGIDQLADDLGVLFQTGDDLIGLFGDPENTGKSNYGDIVQGKKTLPMWFTYQGASGDDKKVLERLVGKQDLRADEAQQVRDIVVRSGGEAKSKELLREYRDKCLQQIERIDMNEDLKKFLRGFAIFLEKRDR